MSEMIFYSWQSELSNATNRGLIEKALEAAAKALREDPEIEISPRVDKDTQGVPGAPDIGAAIFEKIDRAGVFVCDVSLVYRGEGFRPTPNPNVLVELGYALARLGWSRVVMVVNEAYGPINELPFDLNKKRALAYTASAEDAQRAPARDELRKKLQAALAVVFSAHPPVAVVETPSPADVVISAVSQNAPAKKARVREYMTALVEQLDAMKPPPGRGATDDDSLVASLDASKNLVTTFARVSNTIADHEDEPAAVALFAGFAGIVERCEARGGGSHYDTDFDFHRFIAHELFVTFISALITRDCWSIVAALLGESLCVQSLNGPVNETFHRLSVFVKLLKIRSDRLNLRRALLHGDLLKERHESESLADLSPFDRLMEADFFLYLRAELRPAKSPLTEGGGDLWRPWSCVHFSWKTPQFMVRAEHAKFAAQLLAPLGLPDVQTFRERYLKRAGNLAQFFSGSMHFNMGNYDASHIGTK